MGYFNSQIRDDKRHTVEHLEAQGYIENLEVGKPWFSLPFNCVIQKLFKIVEKE